MEKLKIGITVGDINGVGLEVILKTLNHKKIADIVTPVIYGSSKVVSYHKNIVGIESLRFQQISDISRVYNGRLNVINCWQESVNISLGQATEMSGKYAFMSLECAVADLKKGDIDALVTAPINKEAMKMADFPFVGHTEYLTSHLGSTDSLMLMVHDNLRVGLVTNHLPLGEVANSITKAAILSKLRIFSETLKMDFGIERPSIAVLSLNPHASDGGVIGNEEEKVIRPAIVEVKKKKGMLVNGPFSVDGFFGSGQFTKYDGILAMYHDQGLGPFKTLASGRGVNFTAGLMGIRTSPDHGTAFDLAGKNEADPTSFRQALFLAMDIARHRKEYLEMHENVLVKTPEAIKAASGEDEIIKD